MDEETRERKREEIRRRLAAYKAAEAAATSGGASPAAAAAAGSSSSGAQEAQDPGHRSVPLQSNAEANLVAAAGAQRKSAENLKSESAQDFLCALIKAIKFANPSWGLKKVRPVCDVSCLSSQITDENAGVFSISLISEPFPDYKIPLALLTDAPYSTIRAHVTNNYI